MIEDGIIFILSCGGLILISGQVRYLHPFHLLPMSRTKDRIGCFSMLRYMNVRPGMTHSTWIYGSGELRVVYDIIT